MNKSRSEHIAVNKLSEEFCIIFMSRLGKCLYNSVPKLITHIRDYVRLYLHTMYKVIGQKAGPNQKLNSVANIIFAKCYIRWQS